MSSVQTAPAPKTGKASERIVSLDQFRGYTVIGMLLVNFLGSFQACPQVWRHTHDYNSYADTIMPQFLFAVGFAFRLTFGRRTQLQGTAAAYGRVVRRMLGLVLVSLVVYTVGPRAETWEKLTEIGVWGAIRDPLKRDWFQTLMHIAVTGLWLVPVIRASAKVRLLYMLGSAIAHVLLSWWFLFAWNNSDPNVIDGGPLGFLTWSIPAIVGTLACDAVVGLNGRRPNLAGMFGWSLVLMGVAWGLSCGTRFYDVSPEQAEAIRSASKEEIEQLRKQKLAEHPVIPTREAIDAKLKSGDLSSLLAEPPFVKPPTAEFRKWNYWMMSQRAGTLTYLMFSAGFALAVYVLFYIACDIYALQLPLFRTFGTNALAAYVFHDLVGTAVKPFMPKDSPWWYVTAGLLVFYGIVWLFLRHFERDEVYLRV